MRIRETLASSVLAASLAGGCSADQAPEDALRFQTYEDMQEDERTGSFSSIDCERNPNNWAVHIDSDPGDVGSYDTATIAGSFEQQHYGATVRELGGGALKYQIVTSDHEEGDSDEVDLSSEAYSRVIPATRDFSVVVSSRLGEDGRAYFAANCLPNFRFDGDKESVPLNELPIAPIPEETTSSQNIEA